MKKLSLMLSGVGVAALFMTSCNQHEKEAAIEKAYTIQLDQNESYTFTLPENKRNDEYEFSTQASHYSVSTLGTNASGHQIYQYTPALNYQGTDQVVVRNDQELQEDHPQQCGPPNGGGGQCGFGQNNGGPEDHYIVTINFEVGRTVSASTAK